MALEIEPAKMTAQRPLTGRHISVMIVGFFAVVVGVNFAMARLAIGTFSGVVVENSYDASQNFNRWLGEAAREKAMGWKASASRRADGRVEVRIAQDGATPLPASAKLSAEAMRPLGRPDDRLLRFEQTAPGAYLSTAALDDGRWTLRLRLEGSDAAGQAIAWRDEMAI